MCLFFWKKLDQSFGESLVSFFRKNLKESWGLLCLIFWKNLKHLSGVVQGFENKFWEPLCLILVAHSVIFWRNVPGVYCWKNLKNVREPLMSILSKLKIILEVPGISLFEEIWSKSAVPAIFLFLKKFRSPFVYFWRNLKKVKGTSGVFLKNLKAILGTSDTLYFEEIWTCLEAPGEIAAIFGESLVRFFLGKFERILRTLCASFFEGFGKKLWEPLVSYFEEIFWSPWVSNFWNEIEPRLEATKSINALSVRA